MPQRNRARLTRYHELLFIITNHFAQPRPSGRQRAAQLTDLAKSGPAFKQDDGLGTAVILDTSLSQTLTCHNIGER
jgi:hypothetical protein